MVRIKHSAMVTMITIDDRRSQLRQMDETRLGLRLLANLSLGLQHSV
jgi:hypothetical protein